jgi:hypothetical protein
MDQDIIQLKIAMHALLFVKSSHTFDYLFNEVFGNDFRETLEQIK